MALFQELNDEGSTVVIVPHEPEIGEHCKRIVRLRVQFRVRGFVNPRV